MPYKRLLLLIILATQCKLTASPFVANLGSDLYRLNLDNPSGVDLKVPITYRTKIFNGDAYEGVQTSHGYYFTDRSKIYRCANDGSAIESVVDAAGAGASFWGAQFVVAGDYLWVNLQRTPNGSLYCIHYATGSVVNTWTVSGQSSLIGRLIEGEIVGSDGELHDPSAFTEVELAQASFQPREWITRADAWLEENVLMASGGASLPIPSGPLGAACVDADESFVAVLPTGNSTEHLYVFDRASGTLRNRVKINGRSDRIFICGQRILMVGYFGTQWSEVSIPEAPDDWTLDASAFIRRPDSGFMTPDGILYYNATSDDREIIPFIEMRVSTGEVTGSWDLPFHIYDAGRSGPEGSVLFVNNTGTWIFTHDRQFRFLFGTETTWARHVGHIDCRGSTLLTLSDNGFEAFIWWADVVAGKMLARVTLPLSSWPQVFGTSAVTTGEAVLRYDLDPVSGAVIQETLDLGDGELLSLGADPDYAIVSRTDSGGRGQMYVRNLRSGAEVSIGYPMNITPRSDGSWWMRESESTFAVVRTDGSKQIFDSGNDTPSYNPVGMIVYNDTGFVWIHNQRLYGNVPLPAFDVWGNNLFVNRNAAWGDNNFGYYYRAGDWYYSYRHAVWMYAVPASSNRADGVWIWIEGFGWSWSIRDYFPACWSWKHSDWIYPLAWTSPYPFYLYTTASYYSGDNLAPDWLGRSLLLADGDLWRFNDLASGLSILSEDILFQGGRFSMTRTSPSAVHIFYDNLATPVDGGTVVASGTLDLAFTSRTTGTYQLYISLTGPDGKGGSETHVDNQSGSFTLGSQ